MSRYLRYLRIAFSAFCGLMCVLLVVLWVRSYWRYDRFVYVENLRYIGIESNAAAFYFWIGLDDDDTAGWTFRGSWDLSSAASEYPKMANRADRTSSIFEWHSYPNSSVYAVASYWFLVLVASLFGALPWLRCRFSLRTLLFVMMVVAVAIGVVVAVSQ
jgi:hypothetical protein